MQVIPVGFQALNFRYRPIPWDWSDGQFGQRWVPYGMPRFRKSFLQSAFYLFRIHPKTGKKSGPFGTGVLIVKAPAEFGGPRHVYAVTAAHVIKSGASIIRLNKLEPGAPKGTTSGPFVGTRDLDFEPHEWQFDEGKNDLAAIDVTDTWQAKDTIVSAIPYSDLATSTVIEAANITPGENVFMVGLFSSNPGVKYNLPAVRFGNLSQLADELHPLKQGNDGKHPSHVIDMHSRPGYSGSPVFTYRTPGDDLTAITQHGDYVDDYNRPNIAFLKLLGIHSGQFRETVDVTKKSIGESTDAAPIKVGDKLVIQSSMTVVIPADAIVELLESQHFAELRKTRENSALPSMFQPE